MTSPSSEKINGELIQGQQLHNDTINLIGDFVGKIDDIF